MFPKAIHAFVSPPSTSCSCKFSAGVKRCMGIEWDGATTAEKVTPVHLPLAPSPHLSLGPAPRSSLNEVETLESGREKEDGREKWGVAPKNTRACLPSHLVAP